MVKKAIATPSGSDSGGWTISTSQVLSIGLSLDIRFDRNDESHFPVGNDIVPALLLYKL